MPLVIVVGLLVLVWALGFACRQSRWRWMLAPGGPPVRRRVRRHRRRIGDARRHRLAEERARRLVVDLMTGRSGLVANLSAGVVLRPGEVAWQSTQTRLATWTTRPVWVSRSRVTWLGRRAESIGQEAAVSGWQEHGRSIGSSPRNASWGGCRWTES